MLRTISISSNKKLGGCAATYRAGSGNMYATCPNSCPLKPQGKEGTVEIDQDYLEALLDAVPRGGCGWTYSHFGPDQISLPEPGKTVINLSADTFERAAAFQRAGYPTVITLPKDHDAKVDRFEGIRFVRCPAEYNDKVTCQNCGGNGIPLCARADRNYVVKFTAHGTNAKLVGADASGGCYGSSGNVALHWRNTAAKQQEISDAEALRRWVRTLPHGTKIRHHVVGDLGTAI